VADAVPDARTTKRKQQAAATQEQLVLAARDVFEERGYQATTVGAITERAQTAHGTFYLYFKNKEDAFCEVMAGAAAELAAEAAVTWGPDPRTGLADGMRGFLRVFEEHGGLWRALLEGSFQSPRVMEVWFEIRQGFVDRLTRLLDQQRRAGVIRDVDPVLVANALGSMTEWFAFTHLVMQHPPTDESSRDRAAEVLADLWYHAVWGAPPG
jgi:AcrR family transcriptional regulator